MLFLELGGKAVSVLVAWFYYREQPGLLLVPLIFVSVGALGSFAGLAGGVKLVKELRHASLLS